MTPHDVLDFWFGAPGSAQHGQRRSEWFTKNDAFDDLIRERFGTLIDDMLAGGCRDCNRTCGSKDKSVNR